MNPRISNDAFSLMTISLGGLLSVAATVSMLAASHEATPPQTPSVHIVTPDFIRETQERTEMQKRRIVVRSVERSRVIHFAIIREPAEIVDIVPQPIEIVEIVPRPIEIVDIMVGPEDEGTGWSPPPRRRP